MKLKQISAAVAAVALLGVGVFTQTGRVEAKASDYKIVKRTKAIMLKDYLVPDKDYVVLDKNEDRQSVPDAKTLLEYEEPQLTGKTSVAKKINKDLDKRYNQAYKYFKRETNGYDDPGNVIKPDWMIQQATFFILRQKCKVYKSKKYFSVAYKFYYIDENTSTWGESATYSLKTGKKLKFTDVLKGSPSQVLKKMVKKQSKFYQPVLNSYDLSELSFIVKNNKVYPSIIGDRSNSLGTDYFKPIKVEK